MASGRLRQSLPDAACEGAPRRGARGCNAQKTSGVIGRSGGYVAKVQRFGWSWSGDGPRMIRGWSEDGPRKGGGRPEGVRCGGGGSAVVEALNRTRFV